MKAGWQKKGKDFNKINNVETIFSFSQIKKYQFLKCESKYKYLGLGLLIISNNNHCL